MASTKYNVAGVYVTEKDVSQGIQTVNTSVGAMVTRAPRGICNRIVDVPDYQEYVQNFGNAYFLSAASPVYGYGNYAAQRFLNESNQLKVVRIVDANDKYPVCRFTSSVNASTTWSSSAVGYVGVSAQMTPDTPDTVQSIASLDNALNAGDLVLFGALGPGVDGHNIGVTVETFNTSADWLLTYDQFPTDSTVGGILASAANKLVPSIAAMSNALVAAGTDINTVLPIAKKVCKINVYVKKDVESWSDINNRISNGSLLLSSLVPVETFYGTLSFIKDAQGKQLRLDGVINGVSKFIHVVPNANASLPDALIPMNTYVFPLSGGAVSQKNGMADEGDSYAITAWDFFAEKEAANVNILMNWDYNTAVKQKVCQIAKKRMDSIAIGQSGSITDITVAAIKAKEKYGYVDASYIALTAGWDQIYDAFNDKLVFMPKAVYFPALMARTDRVGAVWMAPCGQDRGVLDSITQNKVFKYAEIGDLQSAGINTSRWLRNVGHVMWGQRTAYLVESARNRINVRRCLAYIESVVEQTLFPFCFNIINDDRTRLRISTLLNSFFDDLKGGINPALERTSKVVCNAKNNPASVINSNQMVVDLMIVPTKPVEVFLVQAVIAPSGVSFEEIAS